MGTQQSCCSPDPAQSASPNSCKAVPKVLAELKSKKNESEFKNPDRLAWKTKFPDLIQDFGNLSVVKNEFSSRVSLGETQASSRPSQIPLEARPSDLQMAKKFNASHTASILGSTKEIPSPNPEIKQFIIENLSEDENDILEGNIRMSLISQLRTQEKMKEVRELAQRLTRFLCWLYSELGKKLEPVLGRENFESIVQWIVFDRIKEKQVFQRFGLKQAKEQRVSWESLNVDSNLNISKSLDQVSDEKVLQEAFIRIQKIHTEENPVKKLFRMGQLNDLAEEILRQYPNSAKKKLNHSLILLFWIGKKQADLQPSIEWVESFCGPDPSKKLWEGFYYIKGWTDLLKENRVPLVQNQNEESQFDFVLSVVSQNQNQIDSFMNSTVVEKEDISMSLVIEND